VEDIFGFVVFHCGFPVAQRVEGYFSSLGFLLLVAATFRLRSKSLVVVFRFVSPLYSQLSIEVQEKGSSRFTTVTRNRDVERRRKTDFASFFFYQSKHTRAGKLWFVLICREQQQADRMREVDKQPAGVHCLSTTSNFILHRFSCGYYVHEGSRNTTLMTLLLLRSSSTKACRFAYYYFSLGF
jgi:hypothetical protein